MKNSLFDDDGPYSVEHGKDGDFTMTIPLPTDDEGRLARECPETGGCRGYFKVKLGTGLTGQDTSFCPYCRFEGTSNDFATEEQLRFAQEAVVSEAWKGVNRMVTDSLGLDANGRRTYGGGLFSIQMEYSGDGTVPRPPSERTVRRDVVCPSCDLDHTVFGLATWCPDCGEDVFTRHVEAEITVLRAMLMDSERRSTVVGERAGARDIENCVEDAVSVFEGSMRVLVRSELLVRGFALDKAVDAVSRLGNTFQNIDRTERALQQELGVSLPNDPVWDRLRDDFVKRHPITHNLAVADNRYSATATNPDPVGHELHLDHAAVERLLADVSHALAILHAELANVRP